MVRDLETYCARNRKQFWSAVLHKNRKHRPANISSFQSVAADLATDDCFFFVKSIWKHKQAGTLKALKGPNLHPTQGPRPRTPPKAHGGPNPSSSPEDPTRESHPRIPPSPKNPTLKQILYQKWSLTAWPTASRDSATRFKWLGIACQVTRRISPALDKSWHEFNYTSKLSTTLCSDIDGRCCPAK